MQGRLVPPEPGRFQSFPTSRWRDEFPLARAAGLDAIEWIFDAYGEACNPVANTSAQDEFEALSQSSQIVVKSLCADWFMDFPLVRATSEQQIERWRKLEWLIRRCARLGVERIVIPFVDQSSMRSPDDQDQIVMGLKNLNQAVEDGHVEIHLETDLAPLDFAALLAKLPFPWLRVNYDSGNSASLGFTPEEEFAAYGSRVGSVHLKDRVKGGGTVPLGTGDTDFESLAAELRKVRYRGDFVLQVARGINGDEVAWTRRNLAFARAFAAGLAEE